MGYKNPSNASFETGEESLIDRRTHGGARSNMQETHNQDQVSSNIDHRNENYRDGTWIEQVNHTAAATPQMIERNIGTSPASFENVVVRNKS